MKGISQSQSPDIKTDRPLPSEKSQVIPIPGRKRRYALLKKIVAFSLILVCFYFLGKALYGNLGQMKAYRWDLKPSFLAISFLFLVINLAVSAFAWKRILALFGVTLPVDQSFQVRFVSGLGKYLPGKIWLYLSQIYLGEKARIPKSVTLFSLFLLFGAYNLAGVLVFVASLFLWDAFSPLLIGLLLLTFLSVFLIMFSPPALRRMSKLLALVSKRFKEEFTSEELTARGRMSQTGQILLILLADWVIFGAAVYFLVNAFYHLDIAQTVILCGIFAISVISGVASFVIPAGLGVREGVQSYLLSLFLPVPAAILISLAMRIWMTLGEVVCFVVALKIKKPELW
jgi:uncharacterized membrane protein YbhN (UPF0104 family)